MSEGAGTAELGSHEERLAAMADLLRECRKTFIDIVDMHRWQPAAESQAELDLEDLNALDPNDDDPDHPRGFHLLPEAAVTHLEIAALHIEGMAALYDARWVFLTPDLVARSAIEALGNALWLLGTSATTGRQRLARAYLLHYASAERDKQLDGLREQPGQEASHRLRQARARCKRVFPSSSRSKLERGLLDDEVAPGLSEMVRMFFDVLTENGAIVSEKNRTDEVYGYLSTAAHPTLFRVREVRHFVAESGTTELRTGEARQPVLMTSMVFYVVLRSFVNYFGFPPKRCDELADRIEKVFPGAVLD